MGRTNISIIIPALNEEKNILPLVKKVDSAFEKSKTKYELIFIDDHSTDNTFQVINSLTKKYPVSVHLKNGPRGKAQSLLQGFKLAQYNLLGMIDADLQYSPKYLPAMIEKISQGADIVVAERVKKDTSPIRQLLSSSFRKVFAKTLHNLDVDVQSGMKVFKREIIERMTLNPTKWSFDLEFLTKARDSGYKIEGLDINFEERKFGESKVGVIKTSLEIGLSAVKLSLKGADIIPFHPSVSKIKGDGFHYKGKEFVPHTGLSKENSAISTITGKQIIVLGTLLILLGLGLYINWHSLIVYIISALTLLYFFDLLFNFFLIYRSYLTLPEIRVSKKEMLSIKDNQWPTYTIFCPLYKEWEVVSQFTSAISKLDYPKNKLQVLLLLEEDDQETISKIKSYNLPSYFEMVVVPNSTPKTKPKACNYGLKFATGEYSVIYDAEDIPDPDQLKKSVIAFSKVGRKTGCLQAKLNFYNPHQNILTRLFTAEYSLWFDLVLTGLQSIGAPIPLGGTSNHFRTADIKLFQGWDPFNVTEDADLGMRLFKNGYKTAIVDSTTMEEANSQFKNWFKQRSRWIKGYMQTYLVHMRDPKQFMPNWKKPHILTFNLVIGGKVLSMLINPVMWCVTASYFLFRPIIGSTIESFFLTPIFYLAVTSLVLGNFLYTYYYMIGAAKRGQWQLIKFTLLIPVYWLMMSAAAYYAVWELIVRPHHWNKTKHGLHLIGDKKLQIIPNFAPAWNFVTSPTRLLNVNPQGLVNLVSYTPNLNLGLTQMSKSLTSGLKQIIKIDLGTDENILDFKNKKSRKVN